MILRIDISEDSMDNYEIKTINITVRCPLDEYGLTKYKIQIIIIAKSLYNLPSSYFISFNSVSFTLFQPVDTLPVLTTHQTHFCVRVSFPQFICICFNVTLSEKTSVISQLKIKLPSLY